MPTPIKTPRRILEQLSHRLCIFCWNYELSDKNDKECIDQALQALDAYYKARVDISDKDLSKIIMFIRHSLFLPENQKMAELKKMILDAISSHSTRIIKIEGER